MHYCSLFLSKGEPRRVNYWVVAMLAAVDDSWVLRTLFEESFGFPLWSWL